MFCSNCGSRLADGAKFCSECGARVSRPEEPAVTPFDDIEFEEPVLAAEPPKAEVPAADEAPAKPAREKVTFDWSNVVDEPHRKEIGEIKSPWGTTGSIDEKELYAEMTPSTDKSRTMSFIDVLKAEKEERERAAADKAIEYTEVLHFDPDLTAFDEPPKFDEAPQLHMAPLYEDVDAPVKTPFDEPDFEKPEPVFEDEPRFEEPKFEEPKFEEPVFEEPAAVETAPAEPEKPSVEVSRETIAQFDEYVKSFEREAGISSEPAPAEPAYEEPVYEEPSVSSSKFELPDFLKKITDSFKEEEPEAAPAPAEPEPAPAEPEFISDEPPVIELDEEPEEPLFEEPVFEEPAFEEPKYEEPKFEEPKFEEPVFEEPAEKEDDSMEDLYLDIDTNEPTLELEPVAPAAYAEEELEEELDDEDEFDDEDEAGDEDGGIDEDELFREMEESSPAHGMTIAPPADKESEIEALRRRLAELTGTIDKADIEAAERASGLEDLAEDAPAESAEEPEDALFEEPAEDIFEEPAAFEEPADEHVEDIYEELTFEPEVTPDVDELFAGLTPASQPAVEEISLEPAVEAPVIEEPAVEEISLEPAVEAPVVEEPAVEEISLEPAVEAPVVEEPVIEEPAVEEISLEPAVEAPVIEEPAAEEPAVEAEPELKFEAEVTPDVDSLFDSLIPARKAAEIDAEVKAEAPVEDLYLQVDPEEAKAEAEVKAEEAAEEPVIELAEEPEAEKEPEIKPAEEPEEAPAAEEPGIEEIKLEVPAAEEKKETDALSLEELEKDLFGESMTEEAEAEETKKIDKFYTLYRKNEEFQRLLDEEYEKLKHGGGLTEEEKQAVDAIPKMADIEAAKAAAAAAPKAEPEPKIEVAPPAPEIPVESQKVYRPVEDETIYMPKDLVEEQVRNEAAAIAAAKAPVEMPAEQPAAKLSKRDEKKAAKAAAKAAAKEAKKESSAVEVEYEDVEKGSKFLTVLAVIIALILICLLAVILILQIAPDSGAAAWIDSLIGNITANFGLVLPEDSIFLL